MSAPGLTDSEPALDGLLAQLVSGSLVLTDGQGAISKWSDEADLLFGRSAQDVLGRAFFQTLIAAPLAPAGEGWRRFLEAGEAPDARAKVELHALHASGHAFVVELVFIPVKLDEGFDFSLFLEDLAFELPQEQMVARLRAQHPVVVRALRTALSEEVQPWEGWRTAGTLVAFRPLAETPWVEAELAARERASAAAEAETAAALAEPEADPQLDPTGAIAGFADASQIVERLLGAVHKLDELEAATAELPRALEAAAAREAQLASELEARLSQLEWTSGAERERIARLEAAAQPAPAAPVDLSPLEARLAALEAAAAAPAPAPVVAVDLTPLEVRLAALEAAAVPAGPDRELSRRLDAGHAELRAQAERLARLEGPAARELRDAVRTAVRLAQGAADRAAPVQDGPGRGEADALHARVDGLAAELERLTAVREEADRRLSELAERTEAAASASARLEEAVGAAGPASDRAQEAFAAATAASGRAEEALRTAQDASGRAERALGAAADTGEAVGELGGRVDGLADAADEVAALRDRLDGLDERAAALAITVGEVQALTTRRSEGADARFAELRSELSGVLATVESFRTGFDEARHAALAARRDAEQARTAATAAGSATQRSAQQLSSAWRELLSPGGVGTGSGDRTIRALPSREPVAAPPERAPREGFDDQAQPMAVLALDGHFSQLNPAFAKLVGYPEHEFQKAVWPSAHDRGAYRDQQEQLRMLASGELESVALRSTYMHGQGLMIPVTGRISAVRGEDGRPAHLLLRAEERASR